MQYEWDASKARSNFRKHGIDFADVVGVFSDPYAITIRDEGGNEERFVTIGMDYLMRIVVVVFAWKEEAIRIISARKAAPRERKEYEEGL